MAAECESKSEPSRTPATSDSPMVAEKEDTDCSVEGSALDCNCETEFSAAYETLRAELERETNLRMFTERVLDSRQQELETLEQAVSRLRLANQKLIKEPNRQELGSGKGRMGLTPTTTGQRHNVPQQSQTQKLSGAITETQASASWLHFRKEVQRWVQTYFATSAPDAASPPVKVTASAVQGSRFVALLREPARHCTEIHRSDEFHIIAVIMNYLWHNIFSRTFSCPTGDAENETHGDWLNKAFVTIGRENGCEAAQIWRRQTLLALQSDKEFQLRRSHFVDFISGDLAFLLGPVLSRYTFPNLAKALREVIVEPATRLAHDLQTATTIFSLKWPARQAWTRLEVFDCTNLADGHKKVDFGNSVQESDIRQHTTYLFDLAPGLFVDRIEQGNKPRARAIVRPQVLVLVHDGQWPTTLTRVRALSEIARPKAGAKKNALFTVCIE